MNAMSKRLVAEAIGHLPGNARDLGHGQIDVATLALAHALVRAIPPGKALPRVASDEGGCVHMTWDGGGEPVSLTVEGMVLRVVRAPGSRPERIGPFVWDGGEVPREVLDEVPSP